MKVVLVGAEAAGLRAFREVRDRGEVAGVVTDDEQLARAAQEHGAPWRPGRDVESEGLSEWVRAADVDLILNVHSLHLMHPAVVDAPRIGSFNLHPGPLPEYAGLNAPSWAIYNGEPQHAVTLHWMEARIDTGPIAYATSFALEETDSALSVYSRCVRLGVELIVRLLEQALSDPASIPSIQQDLTRRRYFGRDVPADGRIAWARPARELVDFVRACDYAPFRSPWGHPLAKLGDAPLAVLKASRTREAADARPGTVRSAEDAVAVVASGDEWIRLGRLAIDGTVVRPGDVLTPGTTLDDG